ncbi:unnamed protein product [Effrenium voratum]|uniref:Uncharacterized protein n=1 Tax=Effrenium voratum TaxID=2562239 RepID=A0AA36ICB1_9DINO|nr:unnamed protein product [Effrenium voratum]
MGRVCKVSGEHVMSEAEFAAWWNESKHLQDDVFIDVLRRKLATQLQVEYFRRLALVCGDAMLSVDSHWIDAELVVVIRPYSTDPDGEIALVKVARDGGLAAVVNLLERLWTRATKEFSYTTQKKLSQMTMDSGWHRCRRLLRMAIWKLCFVCCKRALTRTKPTAAERLPHMMLPHVAIRKLCVACCKPVPTRTKPT